MNLIRKVAVLLFFLGSSAGTHAALITQTFNSSWSVEVWDYYGTVAALEWHYQPYSPWDPKNGQLTSVEITTQISGTRDDADDTVRIRDAFFTGWSPVSYQFNDTLYIPAGDKSFSGTWTYDFTTSEEIAAVTDYQYFTGVYETGAGTGGAWYYFESRTDSAGHSIDAITTISYYFAPISVSSPSTIFIMGVGLMSLLRRHIKA